jgi:hypothetical protein
MPNRVLREGILTSERINALKPQAELFFRRLMSVVDDYGRYSANPALLRAHCYPLKLDEVREADISRWLTEVESAGLIALYAVETKRYLEMKDFRQQVRAKESKWPQPPSGCLADATQTSGRREAYAPVVGGGGGGGDGDGDGDEGEDGGEVVGGGPTGLPDDEAWLAGLQRQFADRDVAGERVSFLAYCKRKGTAANRGGFVGWLKKASPKLQDKQQEVEKW